MRTHTDQPTTRGDRRAGPRPAAAGAARFGFAGPDEPAPARPTVLQRRPALAYVVLAIGLSWLVWIPSLLVAPQGQGAIYAGAFGPAVAGAIMVRAHGDRVRDWLRGMAIFRVRLRWYAAALAIPFIEPALQALLLTQAGVPVALERLPAQLPLVAMTFVMMLVLGGAQEEPGWRGWLLPRLQTAGMNPLAASLVIGVVWAVWHLPLFVLGPYGDQSFLLYAPMVVAVAVVFTWLHNATGGSVVLAMLLHAQLNTATTWLPVDRAALEAVAGDPAIMTAVQLTLVAGYAVVAGLLVATCGTRLRPSGSIGRRTSRDG